ncbi:MAG: hypothetical protein Kow0059_19570 [Candidatus Sumerlaeia bacterium]
MTPQRIGSAVLIMAALILPVLHADTLFHQNGQVINGTITEETATHITIQSPEYGELRFERKFISKLIRGGVEVPGSDLSRVKDLTPAVTPPAGAPATPPDSSGSGAAPHAANSFDAAPNPFSTAPASPASGAASQPQPAVSAPVASAGPAPASPFSTSSVPAAAAPPASPFGVPPAAADTSANPFQTPPSNANPFAQFSSSTPPPADESTPPAAGNNPSPANPFQSAASSEAAPSVPVSAPAVQLPPAFQLDGDPMASTDAPHQPHAGGSANPFDVANLGEPVIVNAPSFPEATHITRNNHVPRQVPEGAVGVLYAPVKDVKVHNSAGQWEPPQPVTTLNHESEVWAENGKAKVLLQNGATVLIPPSSHVKFNTAASGTPNVEIELKTGRFWISVPAAAPPDSTTVDAPDLQITLQPGIYTIGAEAGQYTRLAVFEGTATGLLHGVQREFQVASGQAIRGNATTGALCSPEPIAQPERLEFDEWDMWALEVHHESANRYMFGAPDPVLQQLAVLDARRLQSASSQADQHILSSREQDRIAELKNAFLQFCIDTRRAPTTEEGYSALVINPGTPNWRGPYYKGPNPPMDCWGMPIKYELKRDAEGRLIGQLLSAGPNRVYSDGRTDDIAVVVPFHRYMK